MTKLTEEMRMHHRAEGTIRASGHGGVLGLQGRGRAAVRVRLGERVDNAHRQPLRRAVGQRGVRRCVTKRRQRGCPLRRWGQEMCRRRRTSIFRTTPGSTNRLRRVDAKRFSSTEVPSKDKVLSS